MKKTKLNIVINKTFMIIGLKTPPCQYQLLNTSLTKEDFTDGTLFW